MTANHLGGWGLLRVILVAAAGGKANNQANCQGAEREGQRRIDALEDDRQIRRQRPRGELRVVEALRQLRMDDPDRFGDWFGGFITTYRSAVQPAADDTPRPRIEVEWDLGQGAILQRHPWSRMAWRRASKGARLYAGGQALAMPVRDAQRLAAANDIDGALYDGLSATGRDAVFALIDGGHYRLDVPGDAE